MKIIVISPINDFQKENDIITNLFENGLLTYHLMKPFYSKNKLQEFIKNIPEQFHNRIIIHSHHTLADKFNLQGIHYSDKDAEPNFINWLRRKRAASKTQNLIKTTSCKKTIDLYKEREINFDYVFLMPVFDRMTSNYQSGYYEEGIKTAIKNSNKKIVVLGGVNLIRAKQIIELGFYGMGLSSCLWENESPVEEYCKIVHQCKELGATIE
jgi:thiamine-phosphate pyrophosphorylase